MRLSCLILFTVLGSMNMLAQHKTVNRDNYRIKISKAGFEIKVDGILDEEPWYLADRTGQFTRATPVDTGFAKAQTEAMITYDELNLYVGIICYDPTPGKRIVESLRRDFVMVRNDNCMIYIDPYNDQTNGFIFGVSAYGSQVEGLLFNTTSYSYTLDNKWESAVRNYDDKWVAEFRIPFRSFRYTRGESEWGINFSRVDLKTAEKSVWAPVPRNMNASSLNYAGTLVWDNPLQKAGLSFSFIPYVIGKGTINKQESNDIIWNSNTGFDSKMIISTSVNLDMTINPDYSQVEEDRQVTNLDRFELFFRERRQFFLDNNDLFANLGKSDVRPFFSRRIGLYVPVVGGVRLSGKIGNFLRIGLMDMQTKSTEVIPSSNFAAAVLQRQVFSRSNIVGFLINKQITENNNDTIYSGHKYNRVAGLEYNLSSKNNLWTGKAFYHQTFYPGSTAKAATAHGSVVYLTRPLRAEFDISWVGSDYFAEVGYIRRKGYFEVSPRLKYFFYPANSKIQSHGPGLNLNIIFDPELNVTDRRTQFIYSVNWISRSLFSVDVVEEFVKLSRPFDPTNTGGVELPEASEYYWRSAGFNYSSDPRGILYLTLDGRYGKYYNGEKFSIGGSINYRIQRYGNISITSDYNSISLPNPYSCAKLFLFGPKIDLTFTDKLFLTTYIQYNNQIDNVNLNVRFQWRFAPVSDLFIIYTGNSYSENFVNKNRGFAIKINYWLN